MTKECLVFLDHVIPGLGPSPAYTSCPLTLATPVVTNSSPLHIIANIGGNNMS
jgi:hypothetical protein